WQCAELALLLPFAAPSLGMLPLLAAGLVNPLALVYLGLRVSDASERWRYRIAFATLSLIPFSWVFLATMHLSIGAGHVAWVAGLLLMLLPEAYQFVIDPSGR